MTETERAKFLSALKIKRSQVKGVYEKELLEKVLYETGPYPMHSFFTNALLKVGRDELYQDILGNIEI